VAVPATTDLQPDPEAPAPPSRPAAEKAPAKKAPAKKAASATAWVEPSGDVCPTSHPVKGKLSSKIFHLPGMLNYDRTKPDRCYRDGDSAEADGLRPAKR
jgi:micrococcal nuclease